MLCACSVFLSRDPSLDINIVWSPYLNQDSMDQSGSSSYQYGHKSRFDMVEIMCYHLVIHQYLLLQFIDILSFLFA